MIRSRNRARGGSSAGVSVPFLYDTDTYWWSGANAGNIIDAIEVDTVSFIPEKIQSLANFEQLTKDRQTLNVTDGVNFNKDTARQASLVNLNSITNGSNGYYIALNCQVTTGDSNILSIARASSAIASRGQIYVTSSRNFALKAANNDGGTIAFVGYAPAITLNQWYTLEMEWTCNPNTLRIWYNGVLQTLTSGATGTFNANFPTTDPSEITLGNFSSSDVDSFDGVIQDIIFHDNVPSSDIRQSISDYLVSVRP